VSEPNVVVDRWLPVVGWEGFYEVSDSGRVRSIDRVIERKNGRRLPLRGRILRGFPDTHGHLHVSLPGRLSAPIHRLVARAFIGPCPEGLEVRHLDGVHSNNSLSNLAYGTHAENMQDMQRHGVDVRRNKTHCPYDHHLVSPNLVPSLLRKGHRGCLACSKARSSAWYARRAGRPCDFKAVADRNYELIMAGV
jgi:hypothetical protein